MVKNAYIRKLKGKSLFGVFSEKGKNLGTYRSMSAAKKRLRQIEYFKHINSAEDHLMPRGGEGNVPAFFRQNLDYGERDLVLKKKMKKLKTLASSLESVGLKKEAAKIKNFELKAAVTAIVASLGLALWSVISPPSEEEIEGEVDQATEDSQQIYSEYEPEKDTRLVDIITDTYPNLPTETVVFVAHVLAEQNNIKDFSVDDIVIKKGQKIKVFNNDKIKEIISSLGDKMQKMPKERWTQPDQIPFEYENVRFAPQDLSFISGVEGNELVAYDDKVEGSEWKPGKVPVGRWTIGQGHLLTKDELRTGQINIDGEMVDWRSGITPEQSDKLHQQDLGVNVETAKNFMEGRKLTLAQKMVLHDIGFLYGTDDAKMILEKSLVGDTIDQKKFREAIVNFRVANDAGAAARRIADFLILDGIRLPIPPDDSLNKKYNYYNKYYAGKIPDKEIQFGVPSKNLVDLLTQTYAGFDSNSNPQKTKDFLELVKTNDPKSVQDLLRLLDSLK